ncbi:ABC transporter permease [Evansella cellulosilytica]|uniref:ABC3 transporter permease C-terminal domain-containing protein n=1 Tax=Evansella cellulosilytica (strain ATCC 21833 / DSM 2522 / FERM P-1141 / JCM 9156 / N-4) TaxID=649639 RepID=E6TXH2_EVAC2|nr:FtsX-like permease family protein [Evansella cellulosilytica]ADU28786.1 protein of unknown function DUF214 [Evansella cellulosilytica DSM 2522]
MNIVNKLTLRHLKENKRRTLVTIIGTIISVAMITAVSTLSVSFLDLMQRHQIANNGEWHVQYENVNPEQVETMKNDDNTKDVFLTRDKGYAYLESSENEFKPYLFISEFNREGFEYFPISLVEGVLPSSNNEIIISEHIESNANVRFSIGDELILEVGKRVNEADNLTDMGQTQSFVKMDDESLEKIVNTTKETYTVVGIMERPMWEPLWAPGYTVISYLNEDTLTANDRVNASVLLKDVNQSLYENAELFAEENNISLDSIDYNRHLLRYLGVTTFDTFRATLFSLSAIIIAIIIIGSVALIYNAFSISVSERSRHLGMLSSVGATKKQKRNAVFFEGAVIGLISIPLGLLAGIGGIGITFIFINSFIEDALSIQAKLTVTVTPLSILTACIVSIITIFISAYIPAQRASKVTPIEAIRQTSDIKVTRKKVKTSNIVRKLFGIEGEIGLKNLKRNKRKYQVTVFSLIISIMLFLTVSFFTESIERSVELSNQGVNYDIELYTGEELTSEVGTIFEELKRLDGVTDYTHTTEIQSLRTWINERNLSDSLLEMVTDHPDILTDGKYQYFINIYGLHEDSFHKYTEEIGVSAEQIIWSQGLSAIVVDTHTYQDWETGAFIETKAVKTSVGETIPLFYEDWETNEELHVFDIEVAALTDTLPMGIRSSNMGGLNIIVHASILEQYMTEDFPYYPIHNLYLTSDHPMETQQQIEEIKTDSMSVYNYYQTRQQDKQAMLIISIFIYGFIVLITAISIANILNTISTSISLRKREFAMLKSVGMTPKSFNKMIRYESIFYGIKSLLYGLPISIGFMYLIHLAITQSFVYSFQLPWGSIMIVIVAVFIIVSATMLYSTSKVRKENIIETLKQENI